MSRTHQTITLLSTLAKLVPDEVEIIDREDGLFCLVVAEENIDCRNERDRWIAVGYFKAMIFIRGWNINISLDSIHAVATINSARSDRSFDELDALLSAYKKTIQDENQ